MKKYLTCLLTGAALILLQTAPVFSTDEGAFDGPPFSRTPRPAQLRTQLSGSDEVPAVSSVGSGRFRATVNAARTEISYVLTYGETEGTVFMAHIHFGQHFTNGGISVWFCGDPDHPTSPPPPTVPDGLPLCPESGTLEGTFTAEDVIGPAGQGIAVGEFDEFVRAILIGDTYVNVHSDKHPPGEIRGQIQVGRR